MPIMDCFSRSVREKPAAHARLATDQPLEDAVLLAAILGEEHRQGLRLSDPRKEPRDIRIHAGLNAGAPKVVVDDHDAVVKELGLVTTFPSRKDPICRHVEHAAAAGISGILCEGLQLPEPSTFRPRIPLFNM